VRKFGLAAILTFVDKGATAAMGRVGRRAALLRQQFQGVGKGVRQMRAGLGQVATAAVPLTAAFGLMIKKGADFEQKIAGLEAVTRKAEPRLKAMAKTLGATTAFSATQATEAMTNLARAGLDSNQIAGAIRGTLNAAAAEGIDLATAADMVASNLKAFSIEAKFANAVAGTLALTSARFNTNMIGLQEGLKLAATSAGMVNASLADTSAVLGSLSDIGLKGTLAGTAFRAALTKLLKPSKEGAKALARVGVSMASMREKLDRGDVIGAFRNVSLALGTVRSESNRAALATQIFGLRGMAVAKAMSMNSKDYEEFTKKVKELRKETGATAEEMAKRQLRTLTGQGKLLASAFEGVAVAFSEAFSGQTARLVERMAIRLGQLALAMRVVGGEVIVDPKAQQQLNEIPLTIFEIARGLKDAFKTAKSVFSGIGSGIKWVAGLFGDSGASSARSVTQIVTKVAVLTAAFAPLAIAIGGATRLFGGLASTAVGAGRTILGAFGGILRVFGGAGKLGGLGKAVGRVSDVAAPPVRVVNFHELSGLGTGAARGAAATTVGDVAAKARGRVATAMDTLKGKINGVSSTLGRAGLVGAALGAGYALGTFIDRLTGASTKISNAAFNFVKQMREKGTEDIRRFNQGLKQTATSAESLKSLIALQQRGVKARVGGTQVEVTREFAKTRLIASLQRTGLTQKEIATQLTRLAPLLAKLPGARIPEGAGAIPTKKKLTPAKDALIQSTGLIPVSAGDVVLDRASLAGAVVSQLRGGLAGAAGAGALGGGDPGRTSPPQASPMAPLRIEVPVEIDGRQVARAVAEVQLDEMERGGASLAPGARRGFLERGLVGVES
jgi:TP901 family phage tail tape measure protein